MTVELEKIVEVVATGTGITRSQIMGRSRSAPVVRARHLAMWLAYRSLELSYPQVGQAFDRDHTTIIHAVRTIDGARTVNTDLAAWLDEAV